MPYLVSPLNRSPHSWTDMSLPTKPGTVGKGQLPPSTAWSPLTLNILYTYFLITD